MLGLVVAMDPNRGIGIGDQLPWHIKDDLKVFRRNTLHKTIIMGDRTFFGLPKALPNRKTIVISREEYTFDNPDVSVCHDLIGLFEQAKKSDEEIFVCGGASIYKQALPYVDKMCISFVKKPYEVDMYFPEFDLSGFDCVYEEEYEEFTYREFVRREA